MWEIDNFLKEDSFHATSTLVGWLIADILRIPERKIRNRLQILLKDFELLMVEEAKLVVDCPTVVDEPENYGRHCSALDIKLSAAFHLHHFSCFEQNTEKSIEYFDTIWYNHDDIYLTTMMIECWGWRVQGQRDQWSQLPLPPTLHTALSNTQHFNNTKLSKTSHCAEQHSALNTVLSNTKHLTLCAELHQIL